MRKVTVSRMRERYAQTVLTFRIIYVCCVLTVHNILYTFDNTQQDGLSQIYSFVRTRAVDGSERSLPRCVSCVPHVWAPEPVWMLCRGGKYLTERHHDCSIIITD